MPLTGDDKPSGAFFAPIDLVEDRMRNRVVGVAALFCMYLFVGAQFIDTKTGSAYELTSSVTFASALPAATRLGPSLSPGGAAPVAVMVTSTEGKAFQLRSARARPTKHNATPPPLPTTPPTHRLIAPPPHRPAARDAPNRPAAPPTRPARRRLPGPGPDHLRPQRVRHDASDRPRQRRRDQLRARAAQHARLP